MAFQVVPDTLIVEVRGTSFAQQVENTFYYKYVAVPDETDLEDLLTDLEAVIGTYWLPYLPDSCIITELYARDLGNEVAAQAFVSVSPGQGSATGDGMPSFNTIAIARKSGFTGRSARGRIFWLGLAESMVQGQEVLSTPRAGITNAIVQFDQAAIALSYVPVIVSRYSGGVKRTEGVTYEIQTWQMTDSNVDTRRSRKEMS